MVRRKPFTLAYSSELPRLTSVLRGYVPASLSRELAAAALYHNVAGYLVTPEAARGPEATPEYQWLVDRYSMAVLHSALLRRSLADVVAALAGVGVTPVLLKGPAIADRYYPSPKLRPFADLDLLVPFEALEAGIRALSEVGYEPLEEFRPEFAETYGHDVHLVRRLGGGRIDVELHWRIGDDPIAEGLDYERLLAGSHLLEVEGTAVRVPKPAEQLLVLAVHLLSDRAKRLAWVHDLELVAEDASVEQWEQAFALSAELGLTWVLHRALDYPAALLGHDRPRPLAPGAAPRWGPLLAVETLDMRASPHVGRLALLGWRGRARYLRNVMLPTRAGLEASVGGDGAPLWRLAARHAGRVIASLAPRRS